MSNGRTFDFLMLRIRPLASFSILESGSWMNGMSDCISLCHMSLHLLCIFVFVFLLSGGGCIGISDLLLCVWL